MLCSIESAAWLSTKEFGDLLACRFCIHSLLLLSEGIAIHSVAARNYLTSGLVDEDLLLVSDLELCACNKQAFVTKRLTCRKIC